jgi:hypothetical protein
MEAKHKNALIGALLAVVFVVAVGYAAFAQQLTINGSASISSKWDVHMEAGTATPASTAGTTPTGSVTVADGGLTATFTSTLVSPGDTETFTVPIVNKGTLDAKLGSITLTSTTSGMVIDNTGLTATTADGNIKYTVTSPGTATLTNTTGTANVVIKAEYVNKAGGQGSAQNVKAALTVTMNYIQNPVNKSV